MSNNWRIGIDEENNTELVTIGIFSISRNPIFFGMIISVFGLFLIIAMIKYCYTVDNLAKTVQIVLQSIEPSAFNFYTMLVNKSGNAINRYDGHGKFTQGKRKVKDKKG